MICAAICFSACSSDMGAEQTAAGGAVNTLTVDKDSAQARREEMWKYRDDDTVNQILFVTHTTDSQAVAEFYEKIPEENNAWVMVFRTDAFIGVDQMGEPDEQSGRTPLGDYGIGDAFGIRNDPGTRLKYIDITPTTYACDEDSEYYNQIIEKKRTTTARAKRCINIRRNTTMGCRRAQTLRMSITGAQICSYTAKAKSLIPWDAWASMKSI